MSCTRLSRLQRRILARLEQEERRTRGTMAGERHALVLALGVDKGDLSTSLKVLERNGLICVHRTPGGKAEVIDLTSIGRTQAKVVNKERISLCPH